MTRWFVLALTALYFGLWAHQSNWDSFDMLFHGFAAQDRDPFFGFWWAGPAARLLFALVLLIACFVSFAEPQKEKRQ